MEVQRSMLLNYDADYNDNDADNKNFPFYYFYLDLKARFQLKLFKRKRSLYKRFLVLLCIIYCTLLR